MKIFNNLRIENILETKVKAVEKVSNQESRRVGEAGQDTVQLSASALAAAKAEASKVEEIKNSALDNKPLPDPAETSEAILSKELKDLLNEFDF